MKKKRSIVRIYFLIFILICAAYLTSLIYTSIRYASGIKCTATVTDVEHKVLRNHHTKGGSTKRNETNITYEYTADKTVYTDTVNISGKKHIDKHDEVKIAYLSNDPQKSYMFKEIIWQIPHVLFWIALTVIQLVLYNRFCRPKPDGPNENANDEVI